MDLSDPTRAVTPTLDGPVLAVLGRAGHPLTVGEIARQAARGSEIGIRRSVARLVEQGIVTATQMGRNLVHELNRDHIAAPAAILLANLRLELWNRLRETLAGWTERPVHAAVFGSAARGDGGPESDIDLLLVHRQFPGDAGPRARTSGWTAAVATLAGAMAGAAPPPALPPRLSSPGSPPPDTQAWHASVDALHGSVQRWTGNSLHAIELSEWQWFTLSRSDPALEREIRDHGIVVAGRPRPLGLPVHA